MHCGLNSRDSACEYLPANLGVSGSKEVSSRVPAASKLIKGNARVE